MDVMEHLYNFISQETGPDYKSAFVFQQKLNHKQVFLDFKNKCPKLIFKTKNFSEKHAVSLNLIEEKLEQQDPFATAIFSKDPKKQNVSEILLGKYLKDISNGMIVKSNKNLYMENGQVKVLKNKGNNNKSIDFNGKFKGTEILISHKLTDGIGGAQDNQHDDINHQLKEFDETFNKNGLDYIFIAVCDGSFYDNKKRDILKNRYKHNPNIVITSSREIKNELNKLCQTKEI